MSESFQSSQSSNNHNCCRFNNMSNIFKDPETSNTKFFTTSANVFVNNVEVSYESQWRLVPNEQGAPPDSLQVKKQKQFDNVKLDSIFSFLSQYENEILDETDGTTQDKETKPPPIFIPHVTKNVKALATSIESVISKDECEYKCSNESKVKK